MQERTDVALDFCPLCHGDMVGPAEDRRCSFCGLPRELQEQVAEPANRRTVPPPAVETEPDDELHAPPPRQAEPPATRKRK